MLLPGEPQLREDMAELYGKVAGTFYKPSHAEMENMAAIESRFSAAKNDFKKIKDKHIAKLNEVRTKNKLEPVMLKSFDEFLKSD
jgi:hypothetical protein